MITIIPAIDILDGQCVRLTQGDFSQKTVYHVNPVDQARWLEDQGFKHLHLVDLDGARAGEVQNWGILEAICRQTDLEVDFGGGISSETAIREALARGAKKVNIGSAAVKQRMEFYRWLETFGNDVIILSADVRNERVMISGWQEKSPLLLWELLDEYQGNGGKWVTITDVSKDGMMQGPSRRLYRRVRKEFPDLQVIASGGIRSVDDVTALAEMGVRGVIIGKALYEGKITVTELEPFLC